MNAPTSSTADFRRLQTRRIRLGAALLLRGADFRDMGLARRKILVMGVQARLQPIR